MIVKIVYDELVQLLGDKKSELNLNAVPPVSILLVGLQGSGKTTTLKAIAGLVRPDTGHVEIGNQVVFDSANSIWVPPHKRRVGYLPQEYRLFPHLTVSQNIAFGLDSVSGSAERRVSELLSVFRLDEVSDRRTWELSGGQRQRVALARSIAPNPSVLLLDEPFSALDMELRRELRRELRGILDRTGVPMVVVTHDREEAVAVGNHLHVMEQGRIVSSGTPLGVLGHPMQARVAQLVGIENIFSVMVKNRDEYDGALQGVADSVPISLPLVDAQVGETVKVGVRAEDIILAEKEPSGLSAQNNIPGRVVSVEENGAHYEVTLDCGIKLRSAVTRRALISLDIEPGRRLWAISVSYTHLRAHETLR